MTFAKKQIFFISIILALSMFFAPFVQELYADSLFSNLKAKAKNLIEKAVDKYTDRDFWVDKAADAVTKNIVAKPFKLATAALGIAIGTAIGGPVGATLGAYLGNKIGTHTCSVIGKPIVKGLIKRKLETGEKITVSSVFKVCKSLDMPSLACNTTGMIIGDILGSAIGGIAGSALIACIGGGTILPIIGTITFATLGAKYGKKFGEWLGKKIGEKAFNNTYKAVTGIDRTDDQSAGSSILLSTAKDLAAVDKAKVARTTTGEVIGDVIGSALGTVVGATLSAVTTGGTSSKMADIGEKWGSKLGTSIGKWIGTTFFDKGKEVIDNTIANKNNSNKVTINSSNTGIVTISDNIPSVALSPNLSATSSKINYNVDNANAAYEAYKIAYDNYAEALSDPSVTDEYRQQKQKEYNASYEMYNKIINGK